MWKAVDDLLARGIAEGIFPGCAMAAGQGTRVLFTSVHGTLAQGDARGVTHTTRYDVGLLTEVMATVPLLLYALERGLVSLDDRLGRWLGDVPQDKREITLLHLLTHTSGMSASFLLSQEAEGDRDALGALLRHPLSGSVGAKVRDSAMGFILLGFLLLLVVVLRGKRKFDGQIMWGYFLWYGFGRGMIEGLRTDSLYFFHNS